MWPVRDPCNVDEKAWPAWTAPGVPSGSAPGRHQVSRWRDHVWRTTQLMQWPRPGNGWPFSSTTSCQPPLRQSSRRATGQPVCVLCGDMVETKRELVDLSDEVWRRTRARVQGLSDEEYFWEPVSGCWTIRQRGDGTWVADWPLPRPEPEPFTTIAWRLWHLIDMYGEERAPRWLDVPAQGEPIGHDDRAGAPPATAADGAVLLERAHERWAAHLALATEERLGERIGPVAGPRYADRTRAAYVLHML